MLWSSRLNPVYVVADEPRRGHRGLATSDSSGPVRLDASLRLDARKAHVRHDAAVLEPPLAVLQCLDLPFGAADHEQALDAFERGIAVVEDRQLNLIQHMVDDIALPRLDRGDAQVVAGVPRDLASHPLVRAAQIAAHGFVGLRRHGPVLSMLLKRSTSAARPSRACRAGHGFTSAKARVLPAACLERARAPSRADRRWRAIRRSGATARGAGLQRRRDRQATPSGRR